MRTYKYCPKCGYVDSFQHHTVCGYCKTDLAETDIEYNCVKLNSEITQEIYEKYKVEENPLYNPEAAKERIERQEITHRIAEYTSKNRPKCPTCHSTNIEKISNTQKAVGFVAIGVFSKNFGKTFHCKNCGYRW